MFLVSALLCVSSPAMPAELESPPGEPRPTGVLGHTIIRTYAAIVPAAPDQTLEHAGWGTGLTVSFGLARMVQMSLGLAYYQFQSVVEPNVDCDCVILIRNAVRQTTLSVDVLPPTRSWLRPWVGVGFGLYEEVKNPKQSYSWTYQYMESGTSLGVNWGIGTSARLNERLAIDLGGRYHGTVGHPFLSSTNYRAELDLFTVQAGLSYLVR